MAICRYQPRNDAGTCDRFLHDSLGTGLALCDCSVSLCGEPLVCVALVAGVSKARSQGFGPKACLARSPQRAEAPRQYGIAADADLCVRDVWAVGPFCGTRALHECGVQRSA